MSKVAHNRAEGLEGFKTDYIEVLSLAGRWDQSTFWNVKCLACGNNFQTPTTRVRTLKSCNECRYTRKILGKSYGLLTVVEYTGRNSKGLIEWKCSCSCGNSVICEAKKLTCPTKMIKSCGCVQPKRRRIDLADSSDEYQRIYSVYKGMMARCYKPKASGFSNYGGRGITVCDGWRDSPKSFVAWAIANGAARGLQLDRKDCDGPYSPDNCKFVNATVNQRNRRVTKYVEFRGQMMALADALDLTGNVVSVDTAANRLRSGWTLARTLKVPPDKRNKMSQTTNWKNAEYYFAKVYKKYNIPAKRDSRSGNWSLSDYEVKIEGHDEIKSDSKYSASRPFRHHGKLDEIEAKYCKEKGDFGVLLTKNYKEQGGCITVRDEIFAMMLSHWLGFGTKEELLAIYNAPRKKATKSEDEAQ